MSVIRRPRGYLLGALRRAVILASTALVVAAACGPLPEACGRPDVFCVGLVTDFGSTAEGINHEAWLALQEARSSQLVDRVDSIETIDARDRAANIAALGDAGYDVIVTVGASIADDTVSAALHYPKSTFIGIEQPPRAPSTNFIGLVFHEEQSGFLAGAAAASVTQTDRVAALCEARYIEAMRRYCEGFKAGVKYLGPEVVVSVSYREGSSDSLFQDPAWGKATALDLVNEGADVIFAAGGTTADAALEAAAGKGALVIGAETDQYARLMDIRPQLLTSAVSGVNAGVLELLRLIRAGKAPAREYVGQVGLAPFHDLDGMVSASTKGRLLEIEQALDSGALRVAVPYLSP